MTVSPQLAKFLSLVAWSEGTSTSPATKNDGYDVIVTGSDGKPEIFTDYSHHPFENRPAKQITASIYSTASGRYQLLEKIWAAYQIELKLPDFSPASQDAVAMQLIKERHALEPILDGQIAVAIHACSNIWASLPGNTYGQGGHTMGVLMDEWAKL